MTGVLCRFCKHPIAVMCDVEKMFHVSKEDRLSVVGKYRTNSEPKVLYESSPLQSIIILTLCQLRHEASGQPKGARAGLIGLESVDMAVKLVKETQVVCVKWLLHLHVKLLSDSRKVKKSMCH